LLLAPPVTHTLPEPSIANPFGPFRIPPAVNPFDPEMAVPEELNSLIEPLQVKRFPEPRMSKKRHYQRKSLAACRRCISL
jgi:hypothetical protein